MVRTSLLGCCLCLLPAVQGCGGGADPDGAGRRDRRPERPAEAAPGDVATPPAPEAKPEGPRVFVARHCHYRYADGRLSDEGRAQAAGMAAKLKDKRIELILHSPILRCDETARLVWEGLDRRPRIESVEWLHEDAKLGKDWRAGLAAGNVLLVTHSPVIRQMTDAEKASSHGEITEVK